MSSYCTRSDVYAIGVAPEAFRRPPREVEAVAPSSGILTIRSHGLALNTPVVPVVLSSSTLGAPAAALPAGCPAAGTTCYALPVGSDTFQITTTPSGSPVIFSDSGAGLFGVIVDHGPYLDEAIVAASAVIDEHARAQDPPIAAPALPLLAAHFAARIYITAHAANNPAFANLVEAPSWLRSRLDKLLDMWLQGAPVVGAIDATPAIPEMGAVLVRLDGRDFLECRDNRA